MAKQHKAAIIIILIAGLVLRLYHIEFGLPHSFHADEPEIAELAIKYTFEIKSIVQNGEYYKLIPINFVYGTVPAYFFTGATMLFSKTSNLLGATFDKKDIYVYLRSLNAVVSMALVFVTMSLYKHLYKNERWTHVGIVLAGFFAALNWKYIVHAHYLNVDIIVTVLLAASYLTLFRYYQKDSDTKYTVLTGILVGLAFGTKVTALLGLPLYLFIFLRKHDPRGMFAFLFIIFGVFVASNPFSLIFAHDFAFRTFNLTVKENGLVFDSVDFGIFKYMYTLAYLATPALLGLATFGAFTEFKNKQRHDLNIFMVGTVLIYLIFFTMGTRRVDRWMLPVLPLVITYGVYGITQLKDMVKRPIYALVLAGVALHYAYFPALLLEQFDTNTPKSAAYLYMRDNVSETANKLAITKEGLDPLNKLKGILVINYNVYESQNAQFDLPPSPNGYDYVILSSRPMEYHKNPVIVERFPFYTQAWADFENQVLNSNEFVLDKAFVLPKPNLIELSDVYIYRSVNYEKP